MVLSECEEDRPPDLNEFSNDSQNANSEREIVANSNVDEDEQDETVNFEDLNVTLEEQSGNNNAIEQLMDENNESNKSDGKTVSENDSSLELEEEHESSDEDESSEDSTGVSDFERTLRDVEQRGNKRRITATGLGGNRGRGLGGRATQRAGNRGGAAVGGGAAGGRGRGTERGAERRPPRFQLPAICKAKAGRMQQTTPPTRPQVRHASHNMVREKAGLKGAAKNVKTEKEAFKLFLSENILEKIVRHTNSEGQRVTDMYNESHPEEEDKEFMPTDREKLQAVTGLMMMRGVYRAYHKSLQSLW